MDEALSDLLAACRAQPRSAALQAALMDAAQAITPREVLAHFAAIDPAPFSPDHRNRVAAFLTEGGYDADARRWTGDPVPPEPEVRMPAPPA